jgi:hypothetical protein
MRLISPSSPTASYEVSAKIQHELFLRGGVIIVLLVAVAAIAYYKWERNNLVNFNNMLDEEAELAKVGFGNPAQAEKDAKAEGMAKAQEFEAHIHSLDDSGKAAP